MECRLVSGDRLPGLVTLGNTILLLWSLRRIIGWDLYDIKETLLRWSGVMLKDGEAGGPGGSSDYQCFILEIFPVQMLSAATGGTNSLSCGDSWGSEYH